jgi:hypothetical protein
MVGIYSRQQDALLQKMEQALFHEMRQFISLVAIF